MCTKPNIFGQSIASKLRLESVKHIIERAALS